jgi:pyrimidine operon attenuation protein / uracil phosphoribosyltransferase
VRDDESRGPIEQVAETVTPNSGSGDADPSAPAGSTGTGSTGTGSTGTGSTRVVMDADQIARASARMAHQILEANRGASGLMLLGIPTRGVALARRLSEAMTEVEGVDIPTGALDVTMYRDDLRRHPTRAVGRSQIPGEVDDAVVVLVDDVLYSGRTVRAALDALGDLGRPRAVRLAVLIDRGHRELPIRADHVGKNLPTSDGERVDVALEEIDGLSEVTISREPDLVGSQLRSATGGSR